MDEAVSLRSLHSFTASLTECISMPGIVADSLDRGFGSWGLFPFDRVDDGIATSSEKKITAVDQSPESL